MRLRPSTWPMSNSACSRGDSTPRPAKKSVVFLMISRTVSISVFVRGHARRQVNLPGERREFCLKVGLLERRDNPADVALHDLRQIVEREPDAMIGDAILEIVIGPDPFAA